MPKLLDVQNLETSFKTSDGLAPVLRDVSFQLEAGKSIGVVGESGSGKSVLALSIMSLLPAGIASVTKGTILFENIDLADKSRRELRAMRGRECGMIFQEPMTSLNPVFTIGYQLAEVYKLHFPDLSKAEVHNRCVEILQQVKIPQAEARLKDYPHHLSGGMRQRMMIAMAIACKPKLLIADEPTTALDVTIQAQILDLIAELQSELGMALMFISHDLGVIRRVASETMVMYAGTIVERGPTKKLLTTPEHPYTIGLLQARPRAGAAGTKLQTIPGFVPSPSDKINGCRFATRCPQRQSTCVQSEPHINVGDAHSLSCWFPVTQPSAREALWLPKT